MITMVASNKGGSGKTTTAVNLAVALAARGDKVLLMDSDKQRSASTWYDLRDDNDPEIKLNCMEKRGSIFRVLSNHEDDYDHIIVDVSGNNSKELVTGCTIADQVIAPHQTSLFDLDTMEELDIQAEKLLNTNENLEIFVYQTMASTNAVGRRQERSVFLQHVSEFENLKCLKSVGSYRQVYKDVLSTGSSVIESKNSSASKEIKDLLKERF